MHMLEDNKLYLFCLDEVFEYETYLLVKEFFPKKEIMRQKNETGAFLICEYTKKSKAEEAQPLTCSP